jgi:hypothetical protein
VDRSGAIIISNNLPPVLWRIEPEDSTNRRYELQRDPDNGLDADFGALAPARHDRIFPAWRTQRRGKMRSNVSWWAENLIR